MEPLISVIVPVYNVEPYLRKCVDSILNQTYRNLEVILVDDGSPDGCPAICDEYAEKDARVRVIHKVNGGQSDARNAGLKNACGEYVTFVDSDDWVDLKLYETVMQQLPFEAALFGCTYVYPETGEIQENSPNEQSTVLTWSTDGEKVEELVNRSLFGYACNKVYSRTILQGLSFSNLKLREDLLFNIAVFARTKKIKLLDHAGYFYVQHRESSLHKPYSGEIPNIAFTAEQMTTVHPDLPEEINRKLTNILIKTYLCDSLSKYVFRNPAATKGNTVDAINQIARSKNIVRALRIYADEPHLFMLLTVCIKLNLPNLFYNVVRRIWHE